MSDVAAGLDALVADFDGRLRAVEDLRGEYAFRAEREVIHEVIRRLRDDQGLGFDYLVFVTAADNYLEEPRFDVVYCVRSLPNNVDLRINVALPGEDPEIDTITDLYPAAGWLEREVWDMFGIRFAGHPNLERILMWEGFSGHPLRKDYPLLGSSPNTPGYLGKGSRP